MERKSGKPINEERRDIVRIMIEVHGWSKARVARGLHTSPQNIGDMYRKVNTSSLSTGKV